MGGRVSSIAVSCGRNGSVYDRLKPPSRQTAFLVEICQSELECYGWIWGTARYIFLSVRNNDSDEANAG